MLTKDAIISQLNLYLVNTNVKEAYLFGSYATDSATRNSDIDLILIYETQKRFFDRYKEFDGIYDLLAVSIDLLIYTPEEWKKVNQRLFFENMFKNKRITNVYRKT
ncbi:MAG: nucleotidyltransferase domain-containing protein [Candidatus Cloacimonetes bacterium]|nr:nucleotidyltransferase domain-containing protein [Candidatus Cloacimonadota bacterium]